ncbi:unnamed protein product [Ceratitis capitata]|uniref:(Mediterranean fruit fly) hypothetical protein n=1 Tax=Ceratitis capitata TaxID=7213 RepID=A0A811U917_CERCA|nr:unnamed protein product [Ceratitis capitata]
MDGKGVAAVKKTTGKLLLEEYIMHCVLLAMLLSNIEKEEAHSGRITHQDGRMWERTNNERKRAKNNRTKRRRPNRIDETRETAFIKASIEGSVFPASYAKAEGKQGKLNMEERGKPLISSGKSKEDMVARTKNIRGEHEQDSEPIAIDSSTKLRQHPRAPKGEQLMARSKDTIT